MLPSFGVLGENLKALYHAAAVVYSVKQPAPSGKRDAYLVVGTGSGSRPHKRHMVFVKGSEPNYCDPNEEMDISGTVGRVCKASSSGMDGCEFLCCGRGYDTHVNVERVDCNCKFHWCCNVTCERCKRKNEEQRCK